ncbi:MAG: tryptophan 2,3-dioxygenase [Acidobacteria bacterium]|nr:tryptophan 2,3-dioxygenase [Acidobacteriota bacterium]
MSFDDSIHPPGKGSISYGSYLCVPELTSLQRLVSEPGHHDELLFIIVHQTYELWFKQLLHEIDTIGEMMWAGQVLAASRLVHRCVEIQKVLVSQVAVVETMTPMDFLAFRDKLQPASGFQSAQFREFEYALGIRDTAYLRNYDADPESRQRLERRLERAPVPEAFYTLLRDRGFEAPGLPVDADADTAAAVREARVAAVSRLYAEFESHYDLFLLAEALTEMDQQLMLWRHRHVVMVERVIGGRRGTGGSSGAGYLKTTLEKRAFPELWDARTSMSVHHSY